MRRSVSYIDKHRQPRQEFIFPSSTSFLPNHNFVSLFLFVTYAINMRCVCCCALKPQGRLASASRTIYPFSRDSAVAVTWSHPSDNAPWHQLQPPNKNLAAHQLCIWDLLDLSELQPCSIASQLGSQLLWLLSSEWRAISGWFRKPSRFRRPRKPAKIPKLCLDGVAK